MVKSLIPPVLVVAILGPLSACSDLKAAIDFADERDEFQARTEALQDRSNTAYLGVPDTGSSTYSGEASLGVGTRSDGVILLGEATVTVDFDSNDVTGRIDNFSGFDTQEEFSTYAGSLVLEGGVLGATNPNDVEAQIVGTLTGDDHVIGVDAFWDAHLKGTPIMGVLGDTVASESTFTLNGNEVAGGMVIAVTD